MARCHAPDGARVQTASPPERIEGREALAEHVGMAAAGMLPG